MRRLNLQWMGEDRPTDVLSFPAMELDRGRPTGPLPPTPAGLPVSLGDVVIDVDAVLRQAETKAPERFRRLGLEGLEGWGPLEEATFLFIHGFLHLLGYDHADPGQEREMQAEEAKLMAPFLAPPWRKR